MVAIRGIEAGGLVLEEAPLLTFRGDFENAEALEALNAAFKALPEKKQAAAMALDDAFGRRTKKTLPGIIQTNAFIGDQGEGLLCEVASRFNHSCRPSCEHSWDAEARVLRIFASRDVLAGEDLTISYIDMLADTQERRRRLRQFGFKCMCPICISASTLNGVGEPGSEMRRKRLAEMIKVTEEVAEEDPIEGLELIEETLDMCDREGLGVNAFRSQACFYASRLLTRLGKATAARQRAELAHGYCVMSHGSSHRESRTMEAHLAEL